MQEINSEIAYLLLRLFTGILFLFQGYDKLFRVRINSVVYAYRSDAAIYQIPLWLLKALAWYTSLAEFAGGLCLMAGLFTNYCLYALGLDILLVSIAFSLIEPMWNTRHVFPRFILLILLLILPSDSNQYSLDALLNP